MITYDRSAFGLGLILRVHGSAVYRSILPSLVSVCFLIIFRKLYRESSFYPLVVTREDENINHPYAIGVLVSSTTFLIVFRANQGYARYWEATSAIHHMMSKWLDATTHTAVFHMQCEHYNHIKPPSYFDHPELDSMYLTRARERSARTIWNETDTMGESSLNLINGVPLSPITNETKQTKQRHKKEHIQQINTRAMGKSIYVVPSTDATSNRGKHGTKMFHKPLNKKIPEEDLDHSRDSIKKGGLRRRKQAPEEIFEEEEDDHWDHHVPRPLQGEPRLDGNWGRRFPDGKATFYNAKQHGAEFLFENSELVDLPSFASYQGGRTPPLFLQELAHLSSLCCAVALATLRSDMDGSISPLGVYMPASPWPEVDSDKVVDLKHAGPWYQRFWFRFMYLLGAGKTPEERTRYNAARPLPVLGGVSDNEVLFIQMARGPSAKTTLCWNWLSEFIMREHLAGSLGKIGPPIVSRIIQFLSDGMIYYNHARKIMYIPFPFPHAQLSAVFVLITIPALAFLMEQYVENLFIGCLLDFFSVLCLSGIHEVARELENPFKNIPNELPLVTTQAQYNESLITMFSGYHPDHYWKPPTKRTKSSETLSSINSIPEEDPSVKDSSEPNSRSSTKEEAKDEDDGDKPMPTFSGDDHDQLQYLQQKMEEFGKEIERLKLKQK